MVIPLSSLASSARENLIALAAQKAMPAISANGAVFVERGGLMSYSSNLRDNYRRAAVYVDRILKGANPAELAVEQPPNPQLAINLKTAAALGLTIPLFVLARADVVIE